jgi:hypothetical protein
MGLYSYVEYTEYTLEVPMLTQYLVGVLAAGETQSPHIAIGVVAFGTNTSFVPWMALHGYLLS